MRNPLRLRKLLRWSSWSAQASHTLRLFGVWIFGLFHSRPHTASARQPFPEQMSESTGSGVASRSIKVSPGGWGACAPFFAEFSLRRLRGRRLIGETQVQVMNAIHEWRRVSEHALIVGIQQKRHGRRLRFHGKKPWFCLIACENWRIRAEGCFELVVRETQKPTHKHAGCVDTPSRYS